MRFNLWLMKKPLENKYYAPLRKTQHLGEKRSALQLRNLALLGKKLNSEDGNAYC